MRGEDGDGKEEEKKRKEGSGERKKEMVGEINEISGLEFSLKTRKG